MTETEQQVETTDEELLIMQRMVDDLEVRDPKERDRIVTYLYDRYANKELW